MKILYTGARTKAFRNMSREEVHGYIQNLYKTFAKLTSEEKYEHIYIKQGIYLGYAAALHKENDGIPYSISMQTEDIDSFAEFPDPIYAMKALVEADRIITQSEEQTHQLLNAFTRERIIQLEAKNQDLSIVEAERRYRICIEDKEIQEEQVSHITQLDHMTAEWIDNAPIIS